MTLDLTDYIRDVADFPSPGITFKDITPMLADPAALAAATRALADPHRDRGVTKVAGIEARGFILGTPVALALDAGFVPLRKAGKLPWHTLQQSYALEYGTAELEVHEDAFTPGDRVLIVDDVLATGGTARAAADLVTAAGGQTVALSFLLELTFLDGAAALDGLPHTSVLSC